MPATDAKSGDTKSGFQFVDADGHVLEHPNGMLEYAPADYRDRI